jgi:hypothetical protein
MTSYHRARSSARHQGHGQPSCIGSARLSHLRLSTTSSANRTGNLLDEGPRMKTCRNRQIGTCRQKSSLAFGRRRSHNTGNLRPLRTIAYGVPYGAQITATHALKFCEYTAICTQINS